MTSDARKKIAAGGFVAVLLAFGVADWAAPWIREAMSSPPPLPAIEVTGAAASYFTLSDWQYQRNGHGLEMKIRNNGVPARVGFSFRAFDPSGVVVGNGSISFPLIQPGETGVGSLFVTTRPPPAKIVVTIQ